MKITVTAAEPQDSKLAATLTVSADDVTAAVKKAYKDIANKYRFQGFRKGRAPRPVIDGLVGKDAVRAQATEAILSAAEPLMLDQLDVVPVGNVDYGTEPNLVEDGKEYTAEATVTLRPDCGLSSYDAPEINMPPAEATDAEVDEQIDILKGYHATFEDVEDDHAAAEGDVLTVDIENVENGEPLVCEGRSYVVGSTSMGNAEADNALAGMKKGETKEVSFTTEGHDHTDPETGETEHHDGVKVTVKVTAKDIKKRVIPELDDEFAKKGFGFDTVAEFRDAVKDEITEDKKTSLPTLKENRVIEALAERLELEEVPEDYRKQVFDEIAQDFLGQLQRQGTTLDAWLQARRIQISDFLEDLNNQAADRAKQSLALDALAKNLNLEATEEDVRSEFEKAGVKDVDASVKEFTEAGRMPAVRETIKRTKAVEWLVENAKVTEVDEIAEKRAAKDAE